jgi:hypothetical protein
MGDAMARRLDCPRCRGAMRAGFVMDRADHNVGTVPRWVAGAPEKSFWTGLKTKDRDVLAVTTYRCEKCGYLESYALPDQPVP